MKQVLLTACVVLVTASSAHAFCPEPTSFDRSRYVDQLYEYVVCLAAEHAETVATLQQRISELEGRLEALEEQPVPPPGAAGLGPQG